MALGEVDDGVEVGAAALGGVELEEDLLGCLGDGLVAEAVLEERDETFMASNIFLVTR